MTRQQFIDRATRAAEQALGVPAGWWGTWRDVRGPNGQRVHASGGVWVVSHADLSMPGVWIKVSRHDSRRFAISKAMKL